MGTPAIVAGEVLITRIFKAPRELVFRAWTEPEHLHRWYAPNGCSIHFARIDMRTGGSFHSCVRTPQGYECWCTGSYLEVVPPERLVFTFAVADPEGKKRTPVEAGMDPEWPEETVVTVTFAHHDEGTKMTLHQTVGEALARKTGAYPSWLQMFDKLAENLASGAIQ